ncbi:DUF2326 domain-containing protein [Clostridium perfringens]|nr:DUF2326 domain-containing protein [Clostridium perfringens]
MKLLKLYCNDNRFNTVIFKNGLNLVLAKINNPNSKMKDTHNLGKTKLIELIDFMLLKEIKKNHFLNNPKFSNHIFFLEIELNDGSTLTIKRSIKEKTKISFKKSKNKYNNFINEQIWDYTELPLTTSNKDRNPKIILNSLLNFNVLKKYDYRKSLNYFLRTQNDYKDVFHLSKFVNDVDWKPLLFELLGYNPDDVIAKYEYDKKLESETKYYNQYKKNENLDDSDYNRLTGILNIKEREKEKIQNNLESFDFFDIDNELSRKLIDNFDKEIKLLNSEIYYLEKDIVNLSNSLNKEFSFDLSKVESLYKEINLYFPDQLKKSYSDLINFNKIITSDRNATIENSISEKTQKLKLKKDELKLYNSERSNCLTELLNDDLYDKYKLVQNKLINIEKEIEILKYKLESYSKLKEMNEEIKQIKSEISTLVSNIATELETNIPLFDKIRNSFSTFIDDIINKDGLISITQNKSGNIEFKDEILGESEESTNQNDGYTYKKILCASFDLALLLAYAEPIYSYYSFVMHDGCLESLDPRKQINYLNLITNLCEENDIQYILTLIESDLPTINGLPYKFKDNVNIAVNLSDESESKTLFGFDF